MIERDVLKLGNENTMYSFSTYFLSLNYYEIRKEETELETYDP